MGQKPSRVRSRNVTHGEIDINVHNSILERARNNLHCDSDVSQNNFEAALKFIDSRAYDVYRNKHQLLRELTGINTDWTGMIYKHYYLDRNLLIDDVFLLDNRYALSRGFIKWWFSYDVGNVAENNHEFFRKCCTSGPIELAFMLEEMYPMYRIETYIDNEGYDVVKDYYIFQPTSPEGMSERFTFELCHELNIISTRDRSWKKLNKTKEKSNAQCVCLDESHKKYIVLPCKHYMCGKCFYNWYYRDCNKIECVFCKMHFTFDSCMCYVNLSRRKRSRKAKYMKCKI